MEKWVPVALVAMLLVGGGGGYFTASGMLSQKITTLEDQLSSTQQQVTTLNTSNQGLSQDKAVIEANLATLQASFDSLQTNYDALQGTYSGLQAEYTALSSQYNTLQSGVDSGLASLSADYVQLQKDYDDLSTLVTNKVQGTIGYTETLNHLKALTLAVRSLNSTLWEYCNEVDSFRNTLTTAEVLKMEATVRSVVGSSTDSWTNYQRIHEYVTTNVDYVYDVEVPYISYYNYIDVNGVRYLTDFDVASIENYVQTPEWTLDNGQGDCDDQAALEYAMLRYYNKYVVGTDYNLYLTELDFSDGSSHVTVFMPVSGGKLTILDPAGNYLTKTGSTIASKTATSEIEAYSGHWSSNGGITQIRLYSINMADGSYTRVYEGTRVQVATFLATG